MSVPPRAPTRATLLLCFHSVSVHSVQTHLTRGRKTRSCRSWIDFDSIHGFRESCRWRRVGCCGGARKVGFLVSSRRTCSKRFSCTPQLRRDAPFTPSEAWSPAHPVFQEGQARHCTHARARFEFVHSLAETESNRSGVLNFFRLKSLDRRTPGRNSASHNTGWTQLPLGNVPHRSIMKFRGVPHHWPPSQPSSPRT